MGSIQDARGLDLCVHPSLPGSSLAARLPGELSDAGGVSQSDGSLFLVCQTKPLDCTSWGAVLLACIE